MLDEMELLMERIATNRSAVVDRGRFDHKLHVQFLETVPSVLYPGTAQTGQVLKARVRALAWHHLRA